MGSSGQLEIYFSEAQPALDIRQGDIVAELNEIQGEILANRQVLDGLVLNRKVRTLLLKASKPQHVTIVYDTNELGATYVDERTFFQFSHLLLKASKPQHVTIVYDTNDDGEKY